MSESVRDMLAREAAEAEEHAEAEERGEITPAPGQRGRKRAADPSQVYAVRIPVSQLRKLREAADSLNMQPSALIRQWVIERLGALDASGNSEADVSQLSDSDGIKLGPRRVPIVLERDTGQVTRRRKGKIRARGALCTCPERPSRRTRGARGHSANDQESDLASAGDSPRVG